MYKLQKALNIQEDVFYRTIRGKRTRAVYEPLCYKQRQITLIKSIFDSNEMINLKTIENLYPFMNPIDIIKEEYLDQSFYCLPTHIVKSSLISKAKSILIGIQEHHNMNDVAPSLPPEDINKVIEISIAELKADKSSLFQHQKYIVMEDGFIVKTDYIQLMVDHSKDFLSNLVIRLKQKHKAINKTSLTEREVITAFESVGCSPSIAKTIAPFAMKSMNKEYEDIMKTPYVPELHITVDKWISQYKLKEYQSLVDLRHSIYFNYMSACSFKDKTAKKKLEKYILKDQGNDFLFHLVIYSVLNQSYSQSDIEQSTLDILPADIENSVTMDAKDRKRVIDTFVQSNDHRYDKSDIIQFSQLLQEKKLKELIDEFIVQTKGQLFTKETSLLLDSSKSKFSRLIREQLLNQLKELSLEAMYAPQLLHIVCLILFQSLYKMPLYVSGKCVPIVLMEIKPLLEKKDQELLEFIHDSIIHQDTTEHNTEYERLRTLGIQYAEDWA
ncbi:hypothetical protein BDB01DRAFT_326341 [Pilobolus umbonatus]|nr:hypothetical protein BDB01DRAFT_326341 [Pilobolus umbonatus]